MILIQISFSIFPFPFPFFRKHKKLKRITTSSCLVMLWLILHTITGVQMCHFTINHPTIFRIALSLHYNLIKKQLKLFLISNFCHVLNVVFLLWGDSVAYAHKIQTAGNHPKETTLQLRFCLALLQLSKLLQPLMYFPSKYQSFSRMPTVWRVKLHIVPLSLVSLISKTDW